MDVMRRASEVCTNTTATSMKTRVALAEDNDLLARSLAEKIGHFEGVELRFRARNGDLLLQALAANPHVDVVLMDIEMPVMDGIEATLRLKQRFPQVKVLMLTVFDSDQKVMDAILAGADGYLLKDEPPHKLEEAIAQVQAAGGAMSPAIAAKAIRLLRNPQRPPEEASPDFGLSERELGILEQLCKGLNYNQIAENLFISPSTVRKHIEHIYAKLQVHNKAEAIQRANRHRLV
jgi:DNA-binding NarL/FixJ family response regulator